jgi:hypothetical protein
MKKKNDLDGLYITGISYQQRLLLEAIETGNRPVIVKYLKKLADNITPDIVNKLADYLDPDRKPIKCGPKPKKKRSFSYVAHVISTYNIYCENRELARLILNHDKKEFSLVENSELFDAEENFAPQWKYPLSKRQRDLTELPNKAAIKDLVCQMYKINSRTFDDLRALYNK